MKKLCMLMILALASSLASAAPTLTLVVDQVQLAPSPTAQQFTLNLTLTSDETVTVQAYTINLSLSPVAGAGELKLISATSPAGVFTTNPAIGGTITNRLGSSNFIGTTTVMANTPTVFLSYTIELKGNPQLAKYDLFKNPDPTAANTIGVVGEPQSVPVTITPGYIAVPEPAMAGVVAVLGWMLGRRRRAA